MYGTHWWSYLWPHMLWGPVLLLEHGLCLLLLIDRCLDYRDRSRRAFTADVLLHVTATKGGGLSLAGSIKKVTRSSEIDSSWRYTHSATSRLLALQISQDAYRIRLRAHLSRCTLLTRRDCILMAMDWPGCMPRCKIWRLLSARFGACRLPIDGGAIHDAGVKQ